MIGIAGKWILFLILKKLCANSISQTEKEKWKKEGKEISHAQKLILDRMNNLEKNQEQLQKQLKNLIDELKDKIN